MDHLTRRGFVRAAALTSTGAGVAALAPTTAAAPEAAPGTATTRTVTFTGGTNACVTVSPDGEQLVLEVQGVLWSLPRQGGTAKPLTPVDLEPTRPAWSPDGSRIAFCAYRGGGFHVWTMAPDGSGLRQLTDGPWDDRGVSWSPDSRWIAFSSERGGDDVVGSSYSIWLVDADTGELHRLTHGSHEDYDPAWHPDGSKVVFVRAEHSNGGTKENGRIIASVPAGGGKVTVVHRVRDGAVCGPAVSADGRVAYAYLDPGPLPTGSRTSTLKVDGLTVSDGEDVSPQPACWSADGELFYVADGRVKVRSTGSRSDTAEEIPFTARLDVPRPRYRPKRYDFDSTALSPVRGIHLPALSPDGRSVVFVALNALWLMPIGGRPRKLAQAEPSRYLQMPSWSRDGGSVLYAYDGDGHFAVHRRSLADRSDSVLATGGRLNPALSPDGTQLACQDVTGKLIVRDLRSGVERALASSLHGGGLPGRPSWSPDGRYLAFCDRNRLNYRFREGYNHIRVLDTRTGDCTSHLPLPHSSLSDRGDSGPVWSPDGAWMAVIMESALWVVPVRSNGEPSGPPRRLTDEPADHPSWAGDSKTLLYLSNGKLRLIRRDGTGRRTVPVPLQWGRRLPPRTLVTRVHAGRLWDGTGERVRKDMDIVITGNRISAIEPHRRGAAGRGEHHVDASDSTVIPGLWDAHIHPWQFCYGGRQNHLMLAYGITSCVFMGGLAYESVRVRESVAAGTMNGPRQFATGELIDGSRVASNHDRAHRTADGVRRSLQRAVALDYDFVKTYVRASAWIMAEAARTAHEVLGVRTGGHLCSPGLGLGHDLTTHLHATQRLEYGHALSPTRRCYQDIDEVYRDAEFHIIVTPFTASPLLGADPYLADDPRVSTLMPRWDAALVRNTADKPPHDDQLIALRREMEIYQRLVAEHANLAVGTDAGLVPYGIHLHLALRALHRFGGLTVAQTLRTATAAPARMFGVSDDLGTVEPGKLADLTVIDGNPFQDFAHLVRTTMVLRDGVVHRQADLVNAFSADHNADHSEPHRVDESAWLAVSTQLRREACCAPSDATDPTVL
ncbi:LpqB family beta-propeller domain-containing protein [Streptantibioticus rubrisoli]|uniref:Amidohydrolase family protein n=1 Tax=Streptantibioticus rubrisoli TaxID=1387313 RepID=A0ABT1P960_9ACTN|nr:LpqB family beta-propeller domain-containing protein [Streptantibioticus rubrisoli]MCQ4041341.1 amidohydrolase family protein [Streptantibioticus rubrisoli]